MTRWDAFRLIAAWLRPLTVGESLSVPTGEVPWPLLATLASQHLVSPAIGWAVERDGGVPDEASDYFRALLDLNRHRHDALADGLTDVLTVLNAAGIVPAALKGAAMIVDPAYPDGGARVTADLDLLVPDSAITSAWEQLLANGFVAPSRHRTPRSHHHLPLLVHEGTGLGVELHRQPLERRLRRLLDAERCFAAGRVASFRGTRVVVPHPADQVVHLLAHGQISNHRHRRGIPELRQLLDVAMLQQRHVRSIDSHDLSRRFAETGFAAVSADTGAIENFLLGDAKAREAHAGHRAVGRLQRAITRAGAPSSLTAFWWAASDVATALVADRARLRAIPRRLTTALGVEKGPARRGPV